VSRVADHLLDHLAEIDARLVATPSLDSRLRSLSAEELDADSVGRLTAAG
jgi:hypothetical protein